MRLTTILDLSANVSNSDSNSLSEDRTWMVTENLFYVKPDSTSEMLLSASVVVAVAAAVDVAAAPWCQERRLP